MPELPEVERAAALIRTVATGKKIVKAITTEDAIVFNGVSHEDFSKEITGRAVRTAGRYGKVFYIELEGIGKMPVLHFGMTGKLQIRGGESVAYRSSSGKRKEGDAWPPRFMKFILHLSSANNSDPIVELAFTDPRRLGRIRLCNSPLAEPPISELGFDPILSMPSLQEFTELVLKRSCPIKALLLDQSFSAGVGNWVADEILYHARIHPEQRCNTLTKNQMTALHHQTREVCRIAVSVNADPTRFPESWLFIHRWDKGKEKKSSMRLPGGALATIQWVKVGGRTSAYVTEVQSLPKRQVSKETAGEAREPVIDAGTSFEYIESTQSKQPHESELTTTSEREVMGAGRDKKRKANNTVLTRGIRKRRK